MSWMELSAASQLQAPVTRTAGAGSSPVQAEPAPGHSGRLPPARTKAGCGAAVSTSKGCCHLPLV